MNDIPAAYENTLHHLLEKIRTEPWQTWWAAGAEEVLEIWYDFAAAKAGVTIRYTPGRWRATIRRPARPPSPAPWIRRRSPGRTSTPC